MLHQEVDTLTDLKRVDLHLHTNFSDGSSSVEDVLRVAQIKGLKVIAITDHYSELIQLPKRMSKGDLPRYSTALTGNRVYRGLEVEIIEDGTVSILPETRKSFDVLIAGLHILCGQAFWQDSTSILNSTRFVEKVRLVLITAMESGLIDVLAHVSWLPRSIRSRTYRLIDRNWMQSVIEVASDFNVAIEVNGHWEVPNIDFIKMCIHMGVKLSLGSDAHNLHSIGKVEYGVRILKKLNIPKTLIYLPTSNKLWARYK